MPQKLDIPDHLVPAIRRMVAVSLAKKSDYSGDTPWRNFSETSDFFGMPKWYSGLFNVQQKMSRIKNLITGRKPKNEPLEDSLLDLANYALLTYAMYLDENPVKPSSNIELGDTVDKWLCRIHDSFPARSEAAKTVAKILADYRFRCINDKSLLDDDPLGGPKSDTHFPDVVEVLKKASVGVEELKGH